MVVARTSIVLALVVALTLLGVAVSDLPRARAHADLQSSEPPAGAELEAAPPAVELVFDETPGPGSRAQVLDGCGTDVTAGVAVDGRTVRVRLASGQPGLWSVGYAVLSDADGHPSAGTLSFRVAGAADCSATSPTTSAAGAAPPTEDVTAEGSPPEDAATEGDPVEETAPAPGSGASSAVLLPAFLAVVLGGAVVGLLAWRRRG